eukprot:6186329-Pleurochrysis_carterae.AAC.2
MVAPSQQARLNLAPWSFSSRVDLSGEQTSWCQGNWTWQPAKNESTYKALPNVYRRLMACTRSNAEQEPAPQRIEEGGLQARSIGWWSTGGAHRVERKKVKYAEDKLKINVFRHAPFPSST